MTTMSEEQKKYAIDHYEAGFTNKTLLAKMMI